MSNRKEATKISSKEAKEATSAACELFDESLLLRNIARAASYEIDGDNEESRDHISLAEKRFVAGLKALDLVKRYFEQESA